MSKIKIIIIVCIQLLTINSFAFAQKKTTGSVIDKPEVLSPRQVISGDTISKISNNNYNITLPGSATFFYTPEQDSAYSNAMKLYVPVNTRIRSDLKRFAFTINLQKEIDQGTPLQVALRNMASIPQEAYQPSGAEIYQREYNIMMSQYIPLVRTYNPGSGVISFGAIGKLLGIVEDVSPEIKYHLDYFANVEIVVYSMQAKVIVTLFKGSQQPGNYTLTWNSRNDAGMIMPRGDYVAEVRIGKEKFIRKRIVIQ